VSTRDGLVVVAGRENSTQLSRIEPSVILLYQFSHSWTVSSWPFRSL